MKPIALSASTLKGTSVKNMQNKDIGKIQDLMVELKTGRVLYAVLSFGGFMGLGDKYFAIPMEALIFSDDDQKIIRLDIDEEELQDAPGFNKNDWPTHSTQDEFVTSVYSHYGYDRRTAHRVE